jgi:FkbM family methyltransferase
MICRRKSRKSAIGLLAALLGGTAGATTTCDSSLPLAESEDEWGLGAFAVTAQNVHGLYAVPSDHAVPVVQMLLNGHVHEPRTLERIRQLAGDSGHIVSGGAYIGDLIPAIAKRTSGVVYSFEPVHEHFQFACATVRLNNLTNVVLAQTAVSGKNGVQLMATWRNGKKLGGRSMVASDAATATELGLLTETVTVTAIDELVPPDVNVRVLQLDVEGHVLEALQGATRMLRSWRPHLVLESGGAEADAEVARFVAAFGYRSWDFVEMNRFYSVGEALSELSEY